MGVMRKVVENVDPGSEADWLTKSWTDAPGYDVPLLAQHR